MAKPTANKHGIKPRPVHEAEKAALGPHVMEYAESQKRMMAAQASIKFLVEKFAGEGIVLDISPEGEWSFAPPEDAGPQIVGGEDAK